MPWHLGAFLDLAGLLLLDKDRQLAAGDKNSLRGARKTLTTVPSVRRLSGFGFGS